jgi:hypothetical protein
MKKQKAVVTIVTLCRASMGEYFVGAVQGTVTPAQRRKMAEKYGLGSDDGELDGLGFREVELAEKSSDLKTLKVWYDDESEAGYIEAEEDED